ncbi:MAG TPA: hypothetical protein EYN54_12065, partial [Methylococcaceae bacterium]|nr:hypothetical protein [Methylococcaceae bacterium]
YDIISKEGTGDEFIEPSQTLGVTAELINDLSQAYEFDTLEGDPASAVESLINFPVGKKITWKERTTGNGGGASGDIALTSSVTPNTYNIIQCTGVPTLALVLRIVGDIINMKAWGAKGSWDNDVTTYDDTAAIKAAIDFAQEARQSIAFKGYVTSGYKLYFPTGLYPISSTLTFTAPIQIEGVSRWYSKFIIRPTFVTNASNSVFDFDGSLFADGFAQRSSVKNVGVESKNLTSVAQMPEILFRIKTAYTFNFEYCDFVFGGDHINADGTDDVVNEINLFRCSLFGAGIYGLARANQAILNFRGESNGVVDTCDIEDTDSLTGIGVGTTGKAFVRVTNSYIERVQYPISHASGQDNNDISASGMTVKGTQIKQIGRHTGRTVSISGPNFNMEDSPVVFDGQGIDESTARSTQGIKSFSTHRNVKVTNVNCSRFINSTNSVPCPVMADEDDRITVIGGDVDFTRGARPSSFYKTIFMGSASTPTLVASVTVPAYNASKTQTTMVKVKASSTGYQNRVLNYSEWVVQVDKAITLAEISGVTEIVNNSVGQTGSYALVMALTAVYNGGTDEIDIFIEGTVTPFDSIRSVIEVEYIVQPIDGLVKPS